MNIKQLTCLSAFLACGFISATNAAAQSTVTLPAQTFTNIGSAAINFNFSTFNSSLGTLTSVDVILENVTLSGTAMGTNDSGAGGGPEDIKVFLTGTIDVTAVDSIDVELDANSPKSSGTNVAVGSSISHTYSNVPSTPITGNTQTISAPPSSNVSGYVGNGVSTVLVTVTPSGFGVSGVATATSGSTANFVSGSYSGSATASGSVQIIYHYTPVPEPSETAAWMIGFALCVFAGRKFYRLRAPATVK